MVLIKEQLSVVDQALEGKNLFISGGAGVGKSYLTRALIKEMRKHHKSGVFVTASTGIAATNINGTTLHSFAGIGLGKDSVDRLVDKISNDKMAYKRWINCKCLIVDEISMISASLIDKLDGIARIMRKKDEVFGGIQLIFIGDFFQLAPIGERERYAFYSKIWDKMNRMILVTSHRQKNPEFFDMLNQVRYGTLSSENLSILNLCTKELKVDNGIEPTILYPHIAKVERENAEHLEKIQHPVVVYKSVDTGSIYALKNLNVPPLVNLKLGAQVILTKNLDFDVGLVNGSKGVVIEFREGFPLVRFNNGAELLMKRETWKIEQGDIVIASREQIPLILAWALTIHKSQGMTLDNVIIDSTGTFACGQLYVALSRCTSLSGLHLKNKIHSGHIKVDQDVVKYYSK